MSGDIVMQHREITPKKTHPYIASFTIDPVDLARLQRVIEDAPEMRFLDYDDAEPDAWPVRIACASRAVATAVEDAWG
jgi:hypothetical protein